MKTQFVKPARDMGVATSIRKPVQHYLTFTACCHKQINEIFFKKKKVDDGPNQNFNKPWILYMQRENKRGYPVTGGL
jgi:hypothetical protein